jgi:hypothetical protein
VGFYTDLRATAAALLTDKGQSMTLTKRTSGTYDPATGAATVTEATYSVTGAVFDFPAAVIDGTLIQQGDKKVLVSALGLSVEPDVDDSLTIGGTAHQIVQVKKLSPAGTTVLWTLQVRTP